VVVIEDDAGNLSGRLHTDYLATDEDEERTVAHALEVVHELQRSNSHKESNRSRDFLYK
jgi:hypothetical protein